MAEAMSYSKLMRCHNELMYLEMTVIFKEIYQNLVVILCPTAMATLDF